MSPPNLKPRDFGMGFIGNRSWRFLLFVFCLLTIATRCYWCFYVKELEFLYKFRIVYYILSIYTSFFRLFDWLIVRQYLYIFNQFTQSLRHFWIDLRGHCKFWWLKFCCYFKQIYISNLNKNILFAKKNVWAQQYSFRRATNKTIQDKTLALSGHSYRYSYIIKSANPFAMKYWNVSRYLSIKIVIQYSKRTCVNLTFYEQSRC